jgi:predicted ATPase/transcriptional regulator with XRE-family HTH domain
MRTHSRTEFGDLLKRYRLAAELTQQELARAAGVSTRAISDLERGINQTPRKDTVQLLGAALRLDGPEQAQFAALAHRLRRHAAAPDARPNLPVPLTPIIGREGEVAALRALLQGAGTRLVTLIGPAGVGKTRLGLQVAAEYLGDAGDGVTFVALAAVTHPGGVVPAIAQALGVGESRGAALIADLQRYLRDRRLLLLLDNFEQVIEAAPQVAALLAAAPGLQVLVTSREALRLRGENEFAVPPLALPDRQRLPPPAVLSQVPAVRLFLARALEVKPDFAVTDENAAAVAEICARLDGLPLAIELAAARIKTLSSAALLARLTGRLHLLTTGARDLPVRHQTLRAALEWSYDLLDPAAQTLFARLAVFAGGGTAEAVAAVCQDTPAPVDALDGLARLVDKSLVRQDAAGDHERRFSMLETIREYAADRLEASGERADLRARHAAYYLALAEAEEPAVRGAEQLAAIARLEAEHANIRAALDWFHDSPTGSDAELRLAGALWWFWQLRGYWREGRAYLERALARVSRAHLRQAQARALCGAGVLAWLQGDGAKGWGYLEESVAVAGACGDPRAGAHALIFLARAALDQGDYHGARRRAEESVAVCRALPDPWGLALALRQLASAMSGLGDAARDQALLDESLAVARTVGDRWILTTMLIGMGEMARWRAADRQAATFYREALKLARELGNKRYIAVALANLGFVTRDDPYTAEDCFLESLTVTVELGNIHLSGLSLIGLAWARCALGQPGQAAELLGTAQALLESGGRILDDTDRVDHERTLAAVRHTLGLAAFNTAYDLGRTRSLDQTQREVRRPAP